MAKYAANMGRSPVSVFYEMINMPTTRTPESVPTRDSRMTAGKAMRNAETIFGAFVRLSDNFSRPVECGEILLVGITRSLFIAGIGSLRDCEKIAHHAIFIGDLDQAISEHQAEVKLRHYAHLDANPATRREGLSGNRMNVLDHIDMYRSEIEDMIEDESVPAEDVKAHRREIERLTALLMTPDYE